MRTIIHLSFLITMLALTPSHAAEPRVDQADLALLAGAPFSGTLSYLDYSSDVVEKRPVSIQFKAPRRGRISYEVSYPDNAYYNSKERLVISRSGDQLNGEPIISREQLDDGTLIIVTAFRGEDNNQPADIRMTYAVHTNKLEIRKEVRFDGERIFFERNAYRLTR
ncbi:MAG: hypothetical protein AAAFM81_12770 [Pseudomonadota bacterium]